MIWFNHKQRLAVLKLMNLRTKDYAVWRRIFEWRLKYGTIKENNTDCAKTLVICSDDWDCVGWLVCFRIRFQNKFIFPSPPIISPSPIHKLILMKSHPWWGSFVVKVRLRIVRRRRCYYEQLHRFLWMWAFSKTLSIFFLSTFFSQTNSHWCG